MAEEYFGAQSKAGNKDEDYARAMDRSMTIDSIISLKPTFAREYLNTLNIDALHDLEDALLDTRHSL